ncbi:hypothetical protein [uncultured Maribacter sp.]|uniref:hypothetical protein n=1 Tax=uncultured Maribacter sp. TaxID=431308 RepID=UPI00260BD29A|nr:hypothetical protein [uncultured Maribacter sp.]
MKNSVQHLIFLVLFVASFVTYGQRKKPKYTFKIDEVAAEFEAQLAEKKIDTVMQAYYLFDNGRGHDSTKLFFWTEEAKSYVKAIKNDNKNSVKEFDRKECSEFSKILVYYFEKIKDISSPISKPTLSISHSYGYFIKLEINKTVFKTYLRNERLFDNDHALAKWISMIAEVAKPYITEE